MITVVFYVAGAVAVIATALAVTRANPVHGLLYLVASFLSIALVMATLGAAFVASLEVIIYAGAIMVLFLFVVMMMGAGELSTERKARARAWAAPGLLVLVLGIELVWLIAGAIPPAAVAVAVSSQQVGFALFGRYLIGVEVASFLLLGGLISAYHVGRRIDGAEPATRTVELEHGTGAPRKGAGAAE